MAIPMLDRPGRSSVKRPSAAAVKEKFEAARKSQDWEQKRYKVALAYLSGDQYVYINGAKGTVEEMARTNEDRARLTDNRMASGTRTLTAKLLQRPLVFEVIPTGSDDATIRQARTAEAVAIDLWERQRWEATHRETAWRTMWAGGTAVLSVDWDRTAGQGLGVDEEGRPVGTGDVRISVSNVCEAYTEPGVRDIETAAWWIKAEALPPKVVQAHYKMEKEPKADSITMLLPSARAGWAQAAGPPNLVMVFTYYERPSPANKDGVVSTVVGEQVVAADPWPFPWSDRLNCLALRETVVTDRWCGESILWQAPSIQNAINASLSNTIEHLKYVGNVRGITPDSNMEFLDELTDLPGEWLAYASASGKPEYLEPPNMPAWLTGMADRLDGRLDDLLGVHDVSRGQSPGGIQSGVGLSVLLEADTTPVGLLARRMADGFGRLMSMCLELFALNVTETRTAKVRVGRQTEEWHWTGAEIGAQTRALVPAESVVPRSHEATRARALEMVKLGLIKSMDDYELLADVSPRDRYSETINPQVGKARRENFLMGLGRPVIPRDFDPHDLHIKVHNGYRASQRYDESSPEEQKMCDDHVLAHEVMAAEDAAKKLLQTAQSPALAGAPEANEGIPLPVPGQPPMTPETMPPQLGGGGETR